MHDHAACEDFYDPRQPRLPLCTCGVKSPDPVWHKVGCAVRKVPAVAAWWQGFGEPNGDRFARFSSEDNVRMPADYTAPVDMRTSRERVSARVATLYDAIAHGDQEHRDWLKEAIDNHFQGLPVPAPRGKGTQQLSPSTPLGMCCETPAIGGGVLPHLTLDPPSQSSALDSRSYLGPLGIRMVAFERERETFEFNFAIPYDMAEWFFLHTVTGTSKWIDDQTGIVSTIFHASNRECYVADAFEPKDHRDSITCDFTSSAEALWRLTPFCEARVRLIRELRGKETKA